MNILLISVSSRVFSFPYNGLELKIQMSVSEEYNDNITLEKEEENIKKDFITAVGLGLGVSYNGMIRSLSIDSNINQRFNAKYNEIITSSERVSLSFLNEFSKYQRIQLNDTFSHTRVPDGFDEEFGRVTGDRENYENEFHANYRRDISELFRVNAIYTNSQSVFSDKDENDTSSNGIALNLSYLHSIDTTFTGSYSYKRNNFDSTFHITSVGMKRFISKRLDFNGKVGANFNTDRDGNKKTRLFTNMLLTDAVDENLVAKLSFSRNDSFLSEGGDVFSTWRVQGDIDWELLERLGLTVSGFYGEGEFSSTSIIDKLSGVRSTVSYHFNNNLFGSLSYNYSNLKSTDEDRGYSKNSVISRLSKMF